ncbi:FeoA family protein [Cryptosporangium japonicum]|uniref:FeoA family protein n=1 Tax=Cryptosporangium japonicum TaxID=80872 RepID=A0ABN0V0C1_9ACTN
MTLDELPHRSRAVVVRIDGAGPGRSRVMDLGLLPGAEVTAHLPSPLGDPTAYLVRGCLIALRRDQARLIQVRAT